MNVKIICLLVVVVSACGSDDIKPGELRAPSVLWTQEVGNCGKTVAIDANYDVWQEKGCESGTVKLGKVQRLSPELGKVIFANFEALVGQDSAIPECAISRHQFTLASNVKGEWTRCGTGRTTGDLSGLEGVFLQAATSLNAF